MHSMTITLVPMDEKDFQKYLESSIKDYAEEKVKSGNWAEAEAFERSRQEFKTYLPQGLNSPNNYLFKIVDDSIPVPVGILWIALLRGSEFFVFDIRIDAHYQRRGYGKQAMLLAEKEVLSHGGDRLSLHVFGHNTSARALYEKLGYIITNINMTKPLK